MELLAIADDLTGALEAGASFAQRGLDSVVLFNGSADARVVVVDTESRHLDPLSAEERVRSCAVRDARWIYKKTDSTLRGNIGPELRALASAYPGRRIAYVPAYPANGRTVRGGRLYVNGVPVDRTDYARDHLNPVTESVVRRLVDPQTPCDVFDGESDSDVASVAGEILTGNLYGIVAGPAAIAKAIAEQLSPGSSFRPQWPEVRRCLVVNGSRHQASVQQVQMAVANGWVSAGWGLLSFTPDRAVPPSDVARAIGCAVRDAVSRSSYDAIMVFGGDTAFGIVSALGIEVLRPIGELLPGVVCSKASGFTFITKAGGFGSPDVILRIQEIVNRTT